LDRYPEGDWVEVHCKIGNQCIVGYRGTETLGNKGWRRHLHSIGRQSRNPPRFVSLGMVRVRVH
jgi:hypothetical protein